MSTYKTKLFQAHLNGGPEARMVFAKTLDDACSFLLHYDDVGQRFRQLVIWEATESWTELRGEAGEHTRDTLRAGHEGVAIYWQEKYGEGWKFIERSETSDA